MSNIVNLSKGGVVNLSKTTPSLSKVVVGLGWDPADNSDTAPKKGFFSKLFGSSIEPSRSAQTIDCDAFAILLVDGKYRGQGDIVYFNHLRHDSGAVIHCGDNLTGDGDGDDEQIIINLKDLPSRYTEVVLAVNIYSAHSKHQTFGDIKNAFIRLVDSSNNAEICRYNISNESEYTNKTAVVMGKVEKVNGEWQFKALGEGYDIANIGELASKYI